MQHEEVTSTSLTPKIPNSSISAKGESAVVVALVSQLTQEDSRTHIDMSDTPLSRRLW